MNQHKLIFTYYSMTDPEKIGKRGFKLTEGLFLALAPAFAYLLAFNYEQGFAVYFNIPAKLIQVGIIEVLVFTGVALLVIALLIYAMQIFNFFYLVIDFGKMRPAVRQRIYFLLPFAFFL